MMDFSSIIIPDNIVERDFIQRGDGDAASIQFYTQKEVKISYIVAGRSKSVRCLRVVDLIKEYDGYNPVGMLMYYLDLGRYGFYDTDSGVPYIFADASRGDIIQNIGHFISVSLEIDTERCTRVWLEKQGIPVTDNKQLTQIKRESLNAHWQKTRYSDYRIFGEHDFLVGFFRQVIRQVYRIRKSPFRWIIEGGLFLPVVFTVMKLNPDPAVHDIVRTILSMITYPVGAGYIALYALWRMINAWMADDRRRVFMWLFITCAALFFLVVDIVF